MAGENGTGVDLEIDDEDIEIELEGEDEGGDGGDARASAGNADDGDDDDRRAGESDEDRKARRRAEGQRRRESRRQFVQQDNQIIAELTRQIQGLEKVVGEQQGKQIELDITSAVAARDRWIRHARGLAHEKAKAIEEGRGTDVVRIDEAIDEAKRNATWFDNKAASTKKAVDDARAKAEAGPTPEEAAKANARNFLARHPGFDPRLGDEVSKQVKRLDIAVERAGFNPATVEYWVELERRIEEAGLDVSQARDDDEDDDPPPRSHPSDKQPRRENGQFNSNEPKTEQRKGPPTGGKGGSGGTKIRVPGSVVAMIKEAGMWDDPKTRNQMIREYQANLNKK